MATDKVTAAPPLTPKLIEALKPGEKEFEIADPAAPGLRLRVTPTGAKVFRWYLTSAKRVITIGRWTAKPRPGHVTLAEARGWLEKLKVAHQEDNLRKVETELRALRPVRAAKSDDSGSPTGAPTLRLVAADFMKYVERRRRRPEQARSILEQDIIPALGDRPIAAITSRECRQVVEAVVARGAPTQAGAVLSLMKQLFRFAQGRDDVSQSPAYPLNREALGVVKNTSSRYLSPEEIAAFWKALDSQSMTPTVRNGLRLLLLLGVRSGELLKATWEEIDFDKGTWTIPVAHQKLTLRREANARPFIVPLPPASVEILRELEALAKSVRSPNVMASFHSAGGQITEKALNHAMRRLFTGKEPVLAFPGERPTPHDLRRTLRRTIEETLGVPFHTAERCLNHSLGKIADTYARGDYLDERRAALEKWAAYVERLVAPSESKVAFIDKRRGGT